MALTSRDETDLLLPLLGSSRDEMPFALFLERLRRRAAAAYVSLTIRPGEGREIVDFHAGIDMRQRAHEMKLDELNFTDRIHYDRLRTGRVYSADEFDDHDPVRKATRARDMRKLGLADERVVRLIDEGGVSVWLVMASARPCTAADSALLSSLAPYVTAAMRTFIASERLNLSNAMNMEVSRRTRGGWIVFDHSARVVALAPAAEAMLVGLIGHSLLPGQRLREFGPLVERSLAEAAALFSNQPQAPERTLTLCEDPRLDGLLAPMPTTSVNALEPSAMVLFLRLPAERSMMRMDHLAHLYGLPLREAELAVRLADGLSLAEAGEAMGLTIETTRNYSKRLFAKLGVRGQAELVRAVYESCAMLS